MLSHVRDINIICLYNRKTSLPSFVIYRYERSRGLSVNLDIPKGISRHIILILYFPLEVRACPIYRYGVRPHNDKQGRLLSKSIL